ncbi:MAG TPA: hypothetical protein VHX86_05975 [Tepidisphaeraceae bacterium]|jgi:hypothetical protein|nr:hypothetical protein [Tepidisphaeraceae bacterium]
MWGNALGWKISAVIFLLAIVLGASLHSQMQITDPTDLSLDPKNLAELSPPVPAEGIVERNVSGDAGEKYSAAVANFDDDADACEEFAQNPKGPAPRPMQLVLEATHLSGMNLFDKKPAEIVDYQTDHPSLDNLAKLGGEMESAALLLRRAGKNDESRKFLLAAYALGQNLFRERVDYDEYSHGMGLMDGATTALAEMEPAGSARQKTLQDQQSAMVDFDQKNVQPIYDVLASADPQRIAANAGDVFRFATRGRERMFRVEAILKLGRYRYDAARMADQLAAPRFLSRLSRDSDPVIRAAATAAADLTIEQYRMIH